MTSLPVLLHTRRVSALFARYGESFSLVRSGAARPACGLFAPMDASEAGTYFDANESVGLLRPALSLYMDGATPDPPQVNEVFFRDGRLWTVRKTQLFRLDDAPLLLLALCD